MSRWWGLALLGLVSVAQAGASDEVERLLKADEAPPGVVFEIVTGDRHALDRAIPKVRGHVERLRGRFPGLAIAVVSHGKEEFALTRDNRAANEAVHQGVQSLVEDEDVPVHVCGTFASWYNVPAEAFPDYVDVAPAGPARIERYQDQGYLLITLDGG